MSNWYTGNRFKVRPLTARKEYETLPLLLLLLQQMGGWATLTATHIHTHAHENTPQTADVVSRALTCPRHGECLCASPWVCLKILPHAKCVAVATTYMLPVCACVCVYGLDKISEAF